MQNIVELILSHNFGYIICIQTAQAEIIQSTVTLIGNKTIKSTERSTSSITSSLRRQIPIDLLQRLEMCPLYPTGLRKLM